MRKHSLNLNLEKQTNEQQQQQNPSNFDACDI